MAIEGGVRDAQPAAGYVGSPMPLDPWRHRGALMRCRTCMWFVLKAAAADTKTASMLGRCRRRAPTMDGFPAVFETDWCGDHKLDENKA